VKRIIKIEVPIDLSIKEKKAYQKKYIAYNKDWAVHFVSERIFVYMLKREDAERLKKANRTVRDRILDKLYGNVEEFPCERRVIYRSYPYEYEEMVTINVFPELLERMQKEDLAIVVFKEVHDYEDWQIHVEVWTPERIESEWKKATVVVTD